MARLGTDDQGRRVFEFLLGLRDQRIRTIMSAHGFSEAERERGWRLLCSFGMTERPLAATTFGNANLAALDEWRRTWLPLVRASLRVSHPAACQQLFHGLDRVSGGTIALVPVFLARFAKLVQSSDPSDCGAAAKARSRGFTTERIEAAQNLLEGLPLAAPPAPPKQVDALRATAKEAQTALWNYYVEWSCVARAVIHDAKMLEQLGYHGRQTKKSKTLSNNTAGGTRRKLREQRTAEIATRSSGSAEATRPESDAPRTARAGQRTSEIAMRRSRIKPQPRGVKHGQRQ